VSRFPLGIPLAISFYTFHLISYAVDVTKGRTRKLSIREYLFYLGFFPHVIAGPIVRAWQMVPQIGKVRRIQGDISIGLHYLVVGIFLKAVVANNIAQIIDPYWASAGAGLTGAEHLIVAVFYYCQIYGDFAGYTLMALGMARLIGYRLPGNFRGPMLALDLQDFWRRWHITFSRWLRDYLYIPMGGNRVPWYRQYANLFVTMLLGGLWHGAGWGFLVWGVLHGVGLVFNRLTRKLTPSAPGALRAVYLTVSWALTQSWVLLAWVFFRSPAVSDALTFLSHSFRVMDFRPIAIHKDLLIGLIFATPALLHNLTPLWIRRVPKAHLGYILGCLTAILLLADIMVESPNKIFIYFRF
jgi:alginate O-acetyltransferase complex protein AlgI